VATSDPRPDFKRAPAARAIARASPRRVGRWDACPRVVRRLARRAGLVALVVASAVARADAPADVRYGLAPAGDFRITTGDDSRLAPSAKLYFSKEWIAEPRADVPVADYARGVGAFDDLRAWVATPAASANPMPRTPLVWLGSPERIAGVRIATDARSMTAGGRTRPLELAPKLEYNRSWFDASSAAFFAARSLGLRGESRGDTFIARTFWPEDFRLDAKAPVVPLPADRPAEASIRDFVRSENGGARAPFVARPVWERPGSLRAWEGKPVLLAMVNGAQGDDDEAWGGHFAIGTGVVGPGGAIGDVLVNNFYSLDVVSEKGILAAPVPLDQYLADLNSGQAWYRPSAIAVAVLADDAAARRVQGAFDRVYAQFWRHQLVYRHSTMNCSSISVDTLRAIGQDVPAQPANLAAKGLAWLSVPYAIVVDRSVAQARVAFEYLSEDRTRLFPAVAFEAIVADWLRLARDGARERDGELARMLARDLDAIVLLRVPQLPSSRAFGSWPVASPAEYNGKVPKDPEQRQIVPVPARPFPSNLRDPDLLPEPGRASDVALAVWAVIGALVVAGVAYFLFRWVGRRGGGA